MLKLVIKDFVIQQRIIKRYIISALLLSFFFWFTDMKQMAVSMAMFPIIYGFMNGALHEDEKNNTLRLLLSLPIRKEDIVYARYISVALITVFTGIIFAVLNYTAFAYMPGESNMPANVGMLVIFVVIMVFMFLVSIYLPMAFKLGYIKAAGINRFVMLGIFGVIGGMGVAVGKISKEGEPPEWVLNVIKFLENIDPALIIGAAALFTVLVYLLSMKLSVRFFKSRNVY